MTNEEIFKKLEAFAENRRDDCSENDETYITQYWVGYIDGLRRLYENITDKEVTKVTTNFEKIKSKPDVCRFYKAKEIKNEP